MANYFISDFHFDHGNENHGIIAFERTQFKTIQEHNNFLFQKIEEWAKKIPKGSTLWNLGDFGSVDYLWTTDILRNAGIKCVFMYGNHDQNANLEKFQKYFDEVYQYPIYISDKLVISHTPVAVFDDTINVHGHLHGFVLDSKNYISCSINDVNWNPVPEKYVLNRFTQLPKYNRRFLWEPFAGLMKISEKAKGREDVIVDKDGRIELSASRVLQRLNQR